MPEITFTTSQEVWNFLNKKGEPAEVAKRIVESVWEMDDKHAVKGVLTNCHSGEESEISLEYHIKPSTRDSWRKEFLLMGGPTGYESFYIDESVIECNIRFGWLACAGTKGKWDKLFIPAEEMRKAFTEAGLIR